VFLGSRGAGGHRIYRDGMHVHVGAREGAGECINIVDVEHTTRFEPN
jgi:hypothetical protein